MYFHLSQRCEGDPSREHYLLLALDIATQLPAARRDITFFMGDAGVFALLAVLYDKTGDKQKSEAAVRKLVVRC